MDDHNNLHTFSNTKATASLQLEEIKGCNIKIKHHESGGVESRISVDSLLFSGNQFRGSREEAEERVEDSDYRARMKVLKDQFKGELEGEERWGEGEGWGMKWFFRENMLYFCEMRKSFLLTI